MNVEQWQLLFYTKTRSVAGDDAYSSFIEIQVI